MSGAKLLSLSKTVQGPVDVKPEVIRALINQGPRPCPYSQSQIWEFATSVIKWGRIFKARVSGNVGQIFHETGYLWTRVAPNQVQPEQFNVGGIGATNDGAAGISASTIDEGVLIYYCHWALYVYGHPDNWPEEIQPYRKYAIRLAAVTWAHNNNKRPDGSLLGYLGSIRVYGDWLNGRWAKSDGYPYGSPFNMYRDAIVRIGNELLALQESGQDDEDEEILDMYTEIFGDLITKSWIGELEVNGGGGPYWGPFSIQEIKDFGELVIHYNGPAVGPDDIGHMLNVNTYHIWNKDWRNDKTTGTFLHQKTIAYKSMITDKGEFHLLVPFEWGTWHCGNTPWNKLAMSIYIPIGEDQRMTDVQRAKLYRVCQAWQTWVGNHDRQKIKGHYQLSGTPCPGTIKQDFLVPYWDGADFGEPNAPDVNSRHFKETDIWVINAEIEGYEVQMLDFFNQLGGVEYCGLPLSGMVMRKADGTFEQWFENCLLEFWPNGFGHFSGPHYRLGGAGQRYFALRDTQP